MKITKPKENQILIEDERLKNFKLENETPSGLEQSEFDNIYETLVLGYRMSGMSASKQIFYGDKLSLLTIFTSMLKNLIDSNVITKDELINIYILLNMGEKDE